MKYHFMSNEMLGNSISCASVVKQNVTVQRVYTVTISNINSARSGLFF